MRDVGGINHLGGIVLSVALSAALALAPAIGAHAAGQKVFATPEEAVAAVFAAAESGDRDTIMEIFGREHVERIVGTDEIQARENREEFVANAKEMHAIRKAGDGKMTLVVGKAGWPFPIPLVEDNAGWRFDTTAGIEEIINRRVGENELTAIEVLRAYVDGQRQYAAVDRDGDEVREYAQQIASTPGERDGLYWEQGSDGEVSPFGPLIADARSYLEGRDSGDPFKGYYYRILTRQGENAPAGRYDFVINGHMIAGFAMVAFPADYGTSGVMTFVVSHQGKVYQNDLGEFTDLIAGGMESYNPDDTWTDVP